MKLDIPPHEVALIVHGFVPDLIRTGWLPGGTVAPFEQKLGIVFVNPRNETLGVYWAPYADHARYTARDFRKHTAGRILNVSPSAKKRAENVVRHGDRWDMRPGAGAEIPYQNAEHRKMFLDINNLPKMPTASSGPETPAAAAECITGRSRKA